MGLVGHAVRSFSPRSARHPLRESQNVAVAPEAAVTPIPVLGDIALCNGEISGLAWFEDALILLPQYPDRFPCEGHRPFDGPSILTPQNLNNLPRLGSSRPSWIGVRMLVESTILNRMSLFGMPDCYRVAWAQPGAGGSVLFSEPCTCALRRCRTSQRRRPYCQRRTFDSGGPYQIVGRGVFTVLFRPHPKEPT